MQPTHLVLELSVSICDRRFIDPPGNPFVLLPRLVCWQRELSSSSAHEGAEIMCASGQPALLFLVWLIQLNCGDLYEFVRMGHSKIRMTERCAKVARQHITETAALRRKDGSYLNERRQK